jgi:hypothetical protein
MAHTAHKMLRFSQTGSLPSQQQARAQPTLLRRRPKEREKQIICLVLTISSLTTANWEVGYLEG